MSLTAPILKAWALDKPTSNPTVPADKDDLTYLSTLGISITRVQEGTDLEGTNYRDSYYRAIVQLRYPREYNEAMTSVLDGTDKLGAVIHDLNSKQSVSSATVKKLKEIPVQDPVDQTILGTTAVSDNPYGSKVAESGALYLPVRLGKATGDTKFYPRELISLSGQYAKGQGEDLLVADVFGLDATVRVTQIVKALASGIEAFLVSKYMELERGTRPDGTKAITHADNEPPLMSRKWVELQFKNVQQAINLTYILSTLSPDTIVLFRNLETKEVYHSFHKAWDATENKDGWVQPESSRMGVLTNKDGVKGLGMAFKDEKGQIKWGIKLKDASSFKSISDLFNSPAPRDVKATLHVFSVKASMEELRRRIVLAGFFCRADKKSEYNWDIKRCVKPTEYDLPKAVESGFLERDIIGGAETVKPVDPKAKVVDNILVHGDGRKEPVPLGSKTEQRDGRTVLVTKTATAAPIVSVASEEDKSENALWLKYMASVAARKQSRKLSTSRSRSRSRTRSTSGRARRSRSYGRKRSSGRKQKSRSKTRSRSRSRTRRAKAKTPKWR